ncbi:arsenate reductase ArsC [Phytohalomonas tamaricis]|uniref:arsenate reductase ArsC n=1 Tax=Phytohalomonas tamaricis TaxID=2081032 RepID=UPI000D0BCCDD|nr:arsenate reductase ArsC [Phytohalomonas tamaricis]
MKVLFLCTHNSCRSVLSEALFNTLVPDYLDMHAISAGSQPSGRVNPDTLRALERAGIDSTGYTSKSSEAFADDPPDIVITVCDRAAQEPCPLFLGPALKAHWGLEDPSAIEAGQAERDAAFDTTMAKIRQRFAAFFALPLQEFDRERLAHELERIGEL